MEDQLVQNPIQEPVITPVPVLPPTKNNNFPVVVFAVLTLLLLGSTAFLYYQNQQLKGMLASYQAQPTVSPTLPVYQSPVPSATPDPTANWKTYANFQIGASIKYPFDWSIKEDSNGKSVDFDTMVISPEVVEGNKVNYYFNFQLEDPANFQAWSSDVSTKKLESKTINGLQFERYISADMFYSLNYIYKASSGKIFRFYLGPYTQTERETSLDVTIDQILSTLNFTK